MLRTYSTQNSRERSATFIGPELQDQSETCDRRKFKCERSHSLPGSPIGEKLSRVESERVKEGAKCSVLAQLRRFFKNRVLSGGFRVEAPSLDFKRARRTVGRRACRSISRGVARKSVKKSRGAQHVLGKTATGELEMEKIFFETGNFMVWTSCAFGPGRFARAARQVRIAPTRRVEVLFPCRTLG